MNIDQTIDRNLSEFTQNNKTWKPNILVLGPGGVKGYLELGFLLKLNQEKYLDEINGFVGCSVGSAISLLIISGYSINEIIDDCMDLNIFNDLGDLNLENLKEIPGLLRMKPIENLLKQRIIQKFNGVLSLKELYNATNIFFKIVCFNLDKMEKEYISKDTDPELSCVEAVMMSMAIPALVCPRIYKGNVYVDGAVGDPYPILELDNGTNNILGVYIDSETCSISYKGFFSHLYRCAQASMKILRDQAIEQASIKCKHAALKTPIMDTIGILLTKENKQKMIESGYKAACTFLSKIVDGYKIIIDDEEFPILKENEKSESGEEDLFVTVLK